MPFEESSNRDFHWTSGCVVISWKERTSSERFTRLEVDAPFSRSKGNALALPMIATPGFLYSSWHLEPGTCKRASFKTLIGERSTSES